MGSHNIVHSEFARAEQIICEFYSKSLQTILESRIPGLRSHTHTIDSGGLTSSSTSRIKKKDKWLSLALGECPAAMEYMNVWHRSAGDPLVVDLFVVQDGALDHRGSSSDVRKLLKQNSMGVSSPRGQPLRFWSSGDEYNTSAMAGTKTLIERWVVQCESLRTGSRDSSSSRTKHADHSGKGRTSLGSMEVGSPQTVMHSVDGHPVVKRMYKRLLVLLRSVYATTRLVPAYRLFRMVNPSNQNKNFDLSYKISSFAEPFSRSDEELMKRYSFSPVETPFGPLTVSLWYHTDLSSLNLDTSMQLEPQIIVDYVGSPAADPMKYFPSQLSAQSMDGGSRGTSFPLQRSGQSLPVPSQRPHSWTSGIHRPGISSSANPSPSASPSESNTFHSNIHVHHRRPRSQQFADRLPFASSPSSRPQSMPFGSLPSPHRRSMNADDYWQSPPFSHSPSPSPPTNSAGRHLLFSRPHSETAPVSIPQPVPIRNTGFQTPNSSDSGRFHLPPPSPRLTKHESLPRDDRDSGNLGLGYQEHSSDGRTVRKSAELYTGITNLHIHSGHKVFRDGRDDSGRFSGIMSSNSSPRVGVSRSSSRLSFQDESDDYDFACPFAVDDVDTLDSRTRAADRKETLDSAQLLSPSRKSQDAAVGMLVHMLRTAAPLHQDRSYYSHSSKGLIDSGASSEVTASGFLASKRAADALEELKSYKEIRELLLHRSAISLSESSKHHKK